MILINIRIEPFFISASSKGATLWELPVLRIISTVKTSGRCDLVLTSRKTIFLLEKEKSQISLIPVKENSFAIEKTIEGQIMCMSQDKSHLYVLSGQGQGCKVKKIDTSSWETLNETSLNMTLEDPFDFSVTQKENYLIFCTQSLTNPRGLNIHSLDITREKADLVTCKTGSKIANVEVDVKIIYCYRTTCTDEVLLGGDCDIHTWNPSEVTSTLVKKTGIPLWMNHAARLEWKKGWHIIL